MGESCRYGRGGKGKGNGGDRRQRQMCIGDRWEEVLLVRYPSKEAFASMLADPEYREATRHRTAALHEARLVAMEEN